jgi:hypothetical protein
MTAGGTCTVTTTTGTMTNDYQYMPGSDYPTDYSTDTDFGTTAALLLTDDSGNVGISTERSVVDTYAVPHVRDAAFVTGGVAAYSDSADGCSVTRIDPSGQMEKQPLPIEACGGTFAADPVTGTVWVANGDLWSLDVLGFATLVSEGVGDLVTFEPVSGVPITATRGEYSVTSLDGWTVQTDYPINGIGNLGGVGSVVVSTASDAEYDHLIALEGSWGGVMLDEVAPLGFKEFGVDDAGTTLGMTLESHGSSFFGIDVTN